MVSFDTNKCETATSSLPMSPRPSTSKYIQYSSKLNLEKKSKNTNLRMLENWYNSIICEMSTVTKKSVAYDIAHDGLIIECYCIKPPPKNTLVICTGCGKGQHAECTHFEPKPFQEVQYLCANCWTLHDKLQCKATLIVVPQSILNQWIEEVPCLIKFNIFSSELGCHFFR